LIWRAKVAPGAGTEATDAVQGPRPRGSPNPWSASA